MQNDFKSGFICLSGKPNVGKSTLLNCLIGQKVAIISNKPQTTRNKIRAVLTREDYQMVFVDTPGIHKPSTKLGQYMVHTAQRNMEDVDIVLLLVMPEMPRVNDKLAVEAAKRLDRKQAVFLIINKIDTVSKEQLLALIKAYQALYDFDEVIPVSALNGENIENLIACMKQYLPEGPKYFDEETVTDQSEKQIVAEIIREKALFHLDKEIPHGIAVSVESMKKREGKNLMDIEATIFCEKKSHKQIVIGAKGSMLKQIGTDARKAIAAFLDSPIYLNLWVKVRKDWRESELFMKSFGYDKKNI